MTSVGQGTIATTARPKFARKQVSEYEFVEGLSGKVSAENLGKLPFQPQIIKPVMSFE